MPDIITSSATIYTGEAEDMSLVRMVELTIHMPLSHARRLAAHKRKRDEAGVPILAPEAKEVGEPVLKALCDAGIDR